MQNNKPSSTQVTDKPPHQEVVFIPQAHNELLKGATILASAVKSTMGPSGHSVIIDMETGPPLITKDGVTVAKSINLKNRLQSIGAELLKEVASKTNDLAGDGPQPKYAKVLTPNGWTTLGEIKVGDNICGTNGTIQKVLGVFDKGTKDIYRVFLSDGNKDSRVVECSEEHLWSVTTCSGQNRIITTKEMINSGIDRKNNFGGKFFIETTCVEFENNNEQLTIDPYLLGVLIGDGSLSNKFIPKQYLYSSIENRKKLFKGLIDTNGSINSRGLFEFSTGSEQLFLDVTELCRSLGKKIYCNKLERIKKNSYGNKPIYRISELKGNRYGLKIKKIEKTNKQTEMMCIKVSNKDHLYITDDYVPTHNTTTATVLGHGMLAEGIKMISTGRSSIALKRGMDIGTDIVISFLKEKAIPISCKEDIINVGTISANGDRSIGELLAEAIEKVGRDGIITIEPAKSVHTTLQVVEGMQLDNGYVSPFFVTNGDKGTCELENPYILITANKISSMQDIVPTLEIAHNSNRSLLIIADDIEGEALHTLIVNKIKGVLKVCAIKAPSYGEHRADILSDLLTVTGGEVIGSTTEITLKKIKQEHLGSCKKLIVGRNATTVIGNNTDEVKDKMVKRIEVLRNLLENDKTLDALHIDKYRKRLARLSGGIAVIKVGGSTEVEILEKKDRVEDAVNATLAATQEGIVPGGGTALFYAAQHLRVLKAALKERDPDVLAGIDMIADVCEHPMNTIISNTGTTPEIIKDRLKQTQAERKVFYVDVSQTNKEDILDAIENFKNKPVSSEKEKFRYGYNAAKGSYGDLVSEGIIDPVKVTRYALEHACSVVGLMLTCNAVIVNEQED